MRKSPSNEKLLVKAAGEMVSVARLQKLALLSAPRDAAVPLALRKSGSPAGTGTGNITHY